MEASKGARVGHQTLRLAAIAVAYYVTGRVSLNFAVVGVNITPLWPPTGIAVVAFWFFGVRAWPVIMAPAFLLNALISGSWLAALAIAVGNTLAPLLTAFGLRALRFRSSLIGPRDVVLLVVAGVGGMAVSAGLGSSSLLASGVIQRSQLLDAWAVWWAGDTMGVLTVAPLLWCAAWLRPRVVGDARRILEAVTLVTGLGLISWAVFHLQNPRLFILVPLLGLVAWRLEQPGAAAAALVTGVPAAIAAGQNLGPFSEGSVLSAMLTLQTFVVVITLSSLFVAAVVSQQRRTTKKLVRARSRLETRVDTATAALQAANRRLADEVAERTRAQEEARRRADELAGAQAVAHLGSWSWEVETDTVRWSEELMRIFGVVPEELSGTHENFLRLIHPDDRERISDSVARALAAGESFGFEYRMVRPDGEIRSIRVQGRVVRDSENRPLRLVGTAQDVSEWQEAVNALLAERMRMAALVRAEEERRRLEEIFVQAPQPVFLLGGPDHLIEFANPAFVEALGARHCVGKPAREVFSEVDDQGYFELLDHVYATGETATAVEAPIRLDRRADGQTEERFLNFTFQPTRDQFGHVHGILGSGVDVTDMVRARRRVEAVAAEATELYEREQSVTEMLQRSFLPERLPSRRGIALAGRYLPGSGQADVGGDWYDVLALADGRLVLVIGDVEGHGLRAATIMSQLRNALRAYLVEDASPTRALDRLQRFAWATEEDCYATALCVTLEPTSERTDGAGNSEPGSPAGVEATWATAGHPPPLLLQADGRARYLQTQPMAPIGAPPGSEVAPARFVLPWGSTLLLYTDGLVERRNDPIDTGLDRLAAAVRSGPAGLDCLVDQLLGQFSTAERPDDIAILALRADAEVSATSASAVSRVASA